MTQSDIFKAIQTHCLSKPDALEDYPWEHVGWKVKKKLFCIGSQDSGHITVKSTKEKQGALVQHPNIEVAAYVGRYGWVTMDVHDAATLELALELIDESYDLVRGKKK